MTPAELAAELRRRGNQALTDPVAEKARKIKREALQRIEEREGRG